MVYSEFALTVSDLHSVPASIKYNEKEEGKEGRENQQCTGISIIITPTPALPLPGFALKSTASIWNKLRFSLFLQPPCEADDSLYQFVFCWSLEAFSRSLLCTLLTELFCFQRTHKLKLYGDTTGKLNGFGTER